MAFYDKIAATAKRMIASRGQSLTLRREVGGSVDPNTGIFTPGSAESLSCSGVWLEITEAINTALGGTVQAGDRVCLLEASQEPLHTDRLSVDGSYWAIVKVQPIAPGGVAVAYYVQARA